MIQNRELRKNSFEKLHDPTTQLYKDLKLLNFCDIAKLPLHESNRTKWKTGQIFFRIKILRL